MPAHSPATIPEAGNPLDEVCQERAIHVDQMLHVRERLLSHQEATRIATLFAVLSDPTRLQVVHALFQAPTGELCVCDLASGLGRDDTTISHQLRVLRNQQIVAMRKVGRVVYYRLIDEQIRHLLQMSISQVHDAPASASTTETEVRA